MLTPSKGLGGPVNVSVLPVSAAVKGALSIWTGAAASTGSPAGPECRAPVDGVHRGAGEDVLAPEGERGDAAADLGVDLEQQVAHLERPAPVAQHRGNRAAGGVTGDAVARGIGGVATSLPPSGTLAPPVPPPAPPLPEVPPVPVTLPPVPVTLPPLPVALPPLPPLPVALPPLPEVRRCPTARGWTRPNRAAPSRGDQQNQDQRAELSRR